MNHEKYTGIGYLIVLGVLTVIFIASFIIANNSPDLQKRTEIFILLTFVNIVIGKTWVFVTKKDTFPLSATLVFLFDMIINTAMAFLELGMAIYFLPREGMFFYVVGIPFMIMAVLQLALFVFFIKKPEKAIIS